MPKSKSIVSQEILDRIEKMGTWDQAISEATLAIHRLQDSVKFFRNQKVKGEPYP
jgi:hypothetical protein